MKAKLKSIASVQMGHSFRTRLDPDQSGNVAVIQMKDLTEDNRLNRDELVVIDMEELKEKHRVEVNDIAFRSRGLTNTAALINAELDDAVIAAPLLRIRIEKKNKIRSTFLVGPSICMRHNVASRVVARFNIFCHNYFTFYWLTTLFNVLQHFERSKNPVTAITGIPMQNTSEFLP